MALTEPQLIERIANAVRIMVTDRCNMCCDACPDDWRGGRRGFSPETVFAALREFDFTGVRRAVITGGEPTIIPALPDCISLLRESGVPEIDLETNAMMLSYPAFADRVTEAGLTDVTITIHHVEPEKADALSRTPGGFNLAMAGLANCRDRGLKITVRFLLTKQLLEDLDALERFIADERIRGVGAIEIAAPRDASEINSAAAERAMRILSGWERGDELPVRFARPWGLPPCLFDTPEDFSYSFNIEPGIIEPGKTKPPACGACVLNPYCSGIPESGAAFFSDAMKPLTRKSSAAAFKRRGEDKALSNFCTIAAFESEDGTPCAHEALLRINYHCNERCLFCWIEPGYANLPHEAVESKIREISTMNIKTLAITGGEPTLNPKLIEYVKLAAGLGIKDIMLQTNAVLLAKDAPAKRLAKAGLTSAFVSLHAENETLSAQITGVNGMFAKTVKGIENLIENGVFVSLSYVLNRLNHASTPDFARFIGKRFHDVPIAFSFAAPLYGAIMHSGIVPRFSEVKAPLTEALEICFEQKTPFAGLAGACGIPPCILDGRTRYYPDLHKVIALGGSYDFAKRPECERCTLNDHCYGVRRFYADIYGLDEIRPVEKPLEMETTFMAKISKTGFSQKVLSKK